MAKRSSSVRGSAARWILIVILVVVVGFAAGFLYSRYGTGFFGSSIKPGYLSNMDSIFMSTTFQKSWSLLQRSKRWCSSH